MNTRIENPMAKADPPDELRNTIGDALIDQWTIKGYGRRQHGLNGKDADLHDGGQVKVDALYVRDNREGNWLTAELTLYADVCQPTDEENETHHREMQEIAEEIVLSFDEYPGEWTGSDYWCFHTKTKVSVPISDEEYDDDGGNEKILEAIAERIATAIYSDPTVKAFQRSLAKLNRELNALHKQ